MIPVLVVGVFTIGLLSGSAIPSLTSCWSAWGLASFLYGALGVGAGLAWGDYLRKNGNGNERD